MGSARKTCATVVQVVHDLVRDTLAQLVGSIISWAAEAVLTVGLATPVIVEQVSTRVSSLATRIGRSVMEVIESAKALKNLLEALKDALHRLASGVRSKLPGAGSPIGDVPSPRAPLPSTARAALPDITDIPHPRDGADVATWAEAVAARHPDLTADEVASIYRYTTNAGYEEMNGFLRDPSALSPTDAARVQRDIDRAVAGLDKLPPYTGMTVRGTDLPPGVLSGYRPGAKVSDPAFWSTTTSGMVAHRFRAGGNALIQIDGLTGVDVQALSHFGDEAEVLLRPGTEFVVSSRTWDPAGFWDLALKEVAR